MAEFLKHVGKYGEKPCVVLYREVPDQTDNCLIVLTQSLKDEMHDTLMNVVQSPEAQRENNLSEVLHRRQFPDNSNMLSALHYGKLIQKVPVAQVNLTPTPAQAVPLADVNAEIRKLEGGYTPPKTDDSHLKEPTGPQAAPVEPTEDGDPKALAESLMVQADLMLEDAAAMKKEASSKKRQAQKMLKSLETQEEKKDSEKEA